MSPLFRAFNRNRREKKQSNLRHGFRDGKVVHTSIFKVVLANNQIHPNPAAKADLKDQEGYSERQCHGG